MAPMRNKKRKSDESMISNDAPSSIRPAKRMATKTSSPSRTPIQKSPAKRPVMKITLAQKQALIDNLQLEITERARKLRAQYMLQAQGLRSRIEIRVNRIPMALRKVKMGELYAKHEGTKASDPILPPKLVASKAPSIKPAQSSILQPHHNPVQTRASDATTIEKENDGLLSPKRRPNNNTLPASRAQLQDAQVLAPRSPNSRTLPKSPIRPGNTAGKSFLARPISPLKPAAPVHAGSTTGYLTDLFDKPKNTKAPAPRKDTATAAGAGRGKRAPKSTAAPSKAKGRGSDASQTSNSSTSSTGTTIVRKAAAKTAVKRNGMGTIKGASGKLPPAPKAGATTTGSRVLRKRA